MSEAIPTMPRPNQVVIEVELTDAADPQGFDIPLPTYPRINASGIVRMTVTGPHGEVTASTDAPMTRVATGVYRARHVIQETDPEGLYNAQFTANLGTPQTSQPYGAFVVQADAP